MDFDDSRVEHHYIEEAMDFDAKLPAKKPFTCLNESEIQRLQQADIAEISSLLSISRASACLLLCHFGWSVTEVHDAWFDHEQEVRKAVGLLKEPKVVAFPNPESVRVRVTCEICLKPFPGVSDFRSAGCGHSYCINCWKEYVNKSIDDGPGCLRLRCPDPYCVAAVDGDMIREFARAKNRDKYDRFLLRSYVDDKKMKWCPGSDCRYAVNFEPNDDDDDANNSDVTCRCSHSFCWNCGEEAHSPVDCEIAGQWIRKNYSESDNIAWILQNAKPCPNCKNPIEKNQGDMLIVCKCGFQFCWLCLRGWSQCGYQGCNLFSQDKVEEIEDQNEEQRKRKMARDYIERYAHYYERWAWNEFFRNKALENLNNAAEYKTRMKSQLGLKLTETDLEFINEAWLQVVECRRVLKWAYVYGYYYLPDEKEEFFEYKQGQAEAALERLHLCVKSGMKKDEFVNDKKPHDDGGSRFDEFRSKLIRLTRVTKDYFENLVRALENGLAEVDVSNNYNYGGVQLQSGERSNYRRGTGTRRLISVDGLGLTDDDFWECEACGHYNVASATKCQDDVCRQYQFN